MIVAVVAGLFALLGGFAGAALTRRTEYEKWLRQERSTVFAEYLRQLYKAQKEATDAIYSTEGTELMRDIRVSEIFVALKAQEGIVRLYLHPDDREEFTKRMREFEVAHSPTADQMLRLKKTEAALNHVQAVFERTIGARQH
ncbi:MAG TPA: hypothetical protein VF450_17465 [Noviherbaspirillum sp.]